MPVARGGCRGAINRAQLTGEKSEMSEPQKIKNFTDLIVWQKGHRLVLEIYKLTEAFPRTEQYGLVSQMRRCAVSVPANIAEGFEKRHQKDKCNFYNIAQGSLSELKYYLILSRELGYLKAFDETWSLAMDVSRLLSGLIKSLEPAGK